MAKAMLYTVNTTPSLVAQNSVIPLGSTTRRFGCAIRQDDNSIVLRQVGYYKITVITEFEPTAETPFIVSLQENNGSVAQAIEVLPTAASAETETVLTTVVRVLCCESKMLNVRISNAGTINKIFVIAEKL